MPLCDFIPTSIHHEDDFRKGHGALLAEIRLTAFMPQGGIVFLVNTRRNRTGAVPMHTVFKYCGHENNEVMAKVDGLVPEPPTFIQHCLLLMNLPASVQI